MSGNAVIRIQCPEECAGCLSCVPELLEQRLRGKFLESGAPDPQVAVFCQSMRRHDIFVPVSGLSMIPFHDARLAVLKLIQYAIRNHVVDDSISIMLVDEDDIERLGNTPPKFASIGNAQPLPT